MAAGQLVPRTDAEAYEAAVGANSRHGLPLTADARRTAVQALLDLEPEWSNRRIARAAGVSEATVRRARRSGASPTHPGVVIGIDGKRYPVAKTSQTEALASRHTDQSPPTRLMPGTRTPRRVP